MTHYWLGVVQRDHVRRGVALGIAQANHGARAGIRRMLPGDGLVYYSPRTGHPDDAPLREFTAVGTVDDGEPWRAEDGEVRPWRRRVLYAEGVRSVPIVPLLDVLELTRGRRDGGVVLRRGFVELGARDFALIAESMGAEGLAALGGSPIRGG